MELPYTIQKVIGENRMNEILGQPDGFVQIGPEKWILPASYTDFANLIYKFEVRADDVFICGYPRSGSTLLQEAIWLICNELNYETALSVPNSTRVTFFE